MGQRLALPAGFCQEVLGYLDGKDPVEIARLADPWCESGAGGSAGLAGRDASLYVPCGAAGLGDASEAGKPDAEKDKVPANVDGSSEGASEVAKFASGELIWDVKYFWSPCRVQGVDAALRSFFEDSNSQVLPDVQLHATVQGKYVSCGPPASNAALLGRLVLRHFSVNGQYKEDSNVLALVSELEMIPAVVVDVSDGQTCSVVLKYLDEAHNLSELYGRPTLWSCA